jgi:hypothetical protein
MTEVLPPGLKLVVLENFSGIPDDPQARDIFMQMAALKIKGYGNMRGTGIIALDSTDFFGTHLLMGEAREGGGIRILGGYRSVRLSECQHFGMRFPTLAILESSGLREKVPEVQRILDSAVSRKIEISYDSSFTILPEARAVPGLSRELRDLMTVLCIHYHADHGVPEWLTQGMVDFKVNEYLMWMGLTPLTGIFPISTLKGAPAMALHFQRASEEALFVARRKRKFWDERLLLSGLELPTARKKAA